MHLDFLPVCFHADISTQASTSANSLMGPVSSLLDCSLPALHKSVQISSRAGIYCLIHYETQQRGQAQKGFTEKPVLPPLQESCPNLSGGLWHWKAGWVAACAAYLFFKEWVTTLRPQLWYCYKQTSWHFKGITKNKEQKKLQTFYPFPMFLTKCQPTEHLKKKRHCSKTHHKSHYLLQTTNNYTAVQTGIIASLTFLIDSSPFPASCSELQLFFCYYSTLKHHDSYSCSA